MRLITILLGFILVISLRTETSVEAVSVSKPEPTIMYGRTIVSKIAQTYKLGTIDTSKPVYIPPETPPEPVFEPFDIPLDYKLQKYIYDLSDDYNVPVELILAVMYVESSFRTDVVSSTNDYGLMQINRINHAWLADEHGLTDMLDPEQNIRAGVIILSDLYGRHNDIHKTLMAYNFGETGARRHWNKGTYSSRYSRKVEATMREFERF